MKRTLSSFFVLIVLSTGLISCGGSKAATTTSGLTFRAFVSNPVNVNPNGGGFPALNIVDATKDLLSPFSVSLSGTVGSAGMMVESPKRDRTVVFSSTGAFTAGSALGIVNNATESASSSVALPGPTESMFVWIDNTTLFAAIPSAPVSGQLAGAIIQANISNSAITATIPVAGAHYLIPSPTGNQILVLSDTANTATVLSPTLISTGNALTPVVLNTGTYFDKPVWAVFSSDGSTAYVMNCGPECGGTTPKASISVIDMTQSSPTVTLVVPVSGGATTGLLSGGNLYVAGTAPVAGTDCQVTLCGTLTVFPSANLSATPGTFQITDGYHNNLVMGPNNQLFIGSRTCTDVIAAGSTPGRGCLSVFNSAGNIVYTAAQSGDVTGIEPITHRNVVYVCEGGALTIYDTALDLGTQRQLQPQKTQVTLVGQAVDVKLADF
ncbi:MAG: hypothetical protein JWN74_1639 [Acidobacteriaceae bacterium]|nr:hypothetical protein [Acidobacteriaceae bacterium]